MNPDENEEKMSLRSKLVEFDPYVEALADVEILIDTLVKDEMDEMMYNKFNSELSNVNDEYINRYRTYRIHGMGAIKRVVKRLMESYTEDC